MYMGFCGWEYLGGGNGQANKGIDPRSCYTSLWPLQMVVRERKLKLFPITNFVQDFVIFRPNKSENEKCQSKKMVAT